MHDRFSIKFRCKPTASPGRASGDRFSSLSSCILAGALTHYLESTSADKENTKSVKENIEKCNVAVKERAVHEKADGNQYDAGNDVLYVEPR